MNTRPYRPYGGQKKRRWPAVLLGLLALCILAFTALELRIGPPPTPE